MLDPRLPSAEPKAVAPTFHSTRRVDGRMTITVVGGLPTLTLEEFSGIGVGTGTVLFEETADWHVALGTGDVNYWGSPAESDARFEALARIVMLPAQVCPAVCEELDRVVAYELKHLYKTPIARHPQVLLEAPGESA